MSKVFCFVFELCTLFSDIRGKVGRLLTKETTDIRDAKFFKRLLLKLRISEKMM